MWTPGVKSHYLSMLRNARLRLEEAGRGINRPNPETLDILRDLFTAASLTLDTLESLARSWAAYTAAAAAARTGTGRGGPDGTAPGAGGTSSR